MFVLYKYKDNVRFQLNNLPPTMCNKNSSKKDVDIPKERQNRMISKSIIFLQLSIFVQNFKAVG